MSNQERAQKVYNAVIAHLEEREFKFERHDNDMVISLTVTGEDLPQPTLIIVQADREIMQVISPIPSKIPEDKRIDGAVAVSVANYGMINGSFDYDMSDGEIRFRVTQSFHDTTLTDGQINYVLKIAFLTTDKYNDKFFMLGKGLMSLEQFIESEGKE